MPPKSVPEEGAGEEELLRRQGLQQELEITQLSSRTEKRQLHEAEKKKKLQLVRAKKNLTQQIQRTKSEVKQHEKEINDLKRSIAQLEKVEEGTHKIAHGRHEKYEDGAMKLRTRESTKILQKMDKETEACEAKIRNMHLRAALKTFLSTKGLAIEDIMDGAGSSASQREHHCELLQESIEDLENESLTLEQEHAQLQEELEFTKREVMEARADRELLCSQRGREGPLVVEPVPIVLQRSPRLHSSGAMPHRTAPLRSCLSVNKQGSWGAGESQWLAQYVQHQRCAPRREVVNRAGLPMQRGDGLGAFTYYCGQWQGDECCGPQSGPQCSDCRLVQEELDAGMRHSALPDARSVGHAVVYTGVAANTVKRSASASIYSAMLSQLAKSEPMHYVKPFEPVILEEAASARVQVLPPNAAAQLPVARAPVSLLRDLGDRSLEMFNELDLNGDGQVTRDEFRQAIKEHEVHLAPGSSLDPVHIPAPNGSPGSIASY